VEFELISSYSFYTFPLRSCSVSEEGSLDLFFYMAAKVSLCGEEFFAPCWYIGQSWNAEG
jgi:hypothetical protein